MLLRLLVTLGCYALATAAQSSVTVQLNNSQILSTAIASGDLQHYYFSSSSSSSAAAPSLLSHITERAPSSLYLSLTACSQPTAPSNYQGEVPSLDIYLSFSSDNALPGPGNGAIVNDSIPGRIDWRKDDFQSDVWIGVVAPTLTDNWTGNWTYEIAVSTDQSMHPLLDTADNNIPYLMLDDTDSTHALFLTPSQQSNASLLLASKVPDELSFSLCAAMQYRIPNYAVNTTQTSRSFGHQQFYVSNLTEGNTYTAYYVQTVNGVSSVSKPVIAQTKQEDNCRLIYGLDFCDAVAYSVPVASANAASMDSIASAYDAQAKDLFQPFQTAISQFNCDTTQYSLVRNCTDCYNAYKAWLCGVTIPRCTSSIENQPVESTSPSRCVRQIAENASRNPWIDDTMTPGEWTELLPCIDLCYHVVQSCPPFMQFNCPTGDLAPLQYGYWQKGAVDVNGTVLQYGIDHPTCNRVGVNASLLTISSSYRLLPSTFSIIIALASSSFAFSVL
ncbi:stretch-activated Ca2+-permeable channel component-domain-containing protein [Syncephalastrum racemosum]|uniref:Stretch-activated Ca2+-permeable channel component-domain-containing protein n=1 Tax=Syncephalastrum racemosum TaxID=13706 RepID=A0A1X2H4Y5_SYNRA|nr:stretch-activated Ca2+-permeable channel component-domain-containing protein [Syncephalastrum racemosum]